MPICNRCGELKSVELYEDCVYCGPIYLCNACRTIHLKEMIEDGVFNV